MRIFKDSFLGGAFGMPQVLRSRRSLGRYASVAMLVGLSAPKLTLAIALGIEITDWTVTQQKLQRTADAAALAAAEAFSASANLQTAAMYGGYVAEINKASGGPNSQWFGATRTFADNMITVQHTLVTVNSGDTAFVAYVKATVPLLFSAYVLAGPSITLVGQRLSETCVRGLVRRGQPCFR